MSKTSDIHIKVQLDAQNVPEDIQWIAKDGGVDSYSQAKGILISFFEKESMDTLKLDLWTKEMQVQEMDRFMFQTLKALSETYLKGTNNTKLASDFGHFANYFGEQTQILPPTN